jgi:hypothetical protein
MERPARSQPELLRELVHFFLEFHQCESDPLNFLVAQTATFYPPNCLPFENLSKELNQRQHQLRQPLLHTLRNDIDAIRQCTTDPQIVQLATQPLELVLYFATRT